MNNKTNIPPEYSDEIWDIVEKVGLYYEENDRPEVLLNIMNFINHCIDYVDESLFHVPKHQINQFRDEAKVIWDEGGDAAKLKEVSDRFSKALVAKIPYRKILRHPPYEGARRVISWYLNNYKDDPTNQFPFDFIELVVFELNRCGVAEAKIKETLLLYFDKQL